MNHLESLRLFWATLILSLILPIKANTREKPNVIIIMADNVGYGDFGLSGNDKVRTPNIDKFAEEGIQFSRFYCNPYCAPTRASIMTGRSHYRTGVIHTSRGGAKMHGDEITIAEYFQEAGYITGMFGKWHLGDNYPMRPHDQGFSKAIWHKSGRIGQVPDYPNTYYSPMLWENDKKIQSEGYCTDVFTDATIKFIESNRDKPFFIYLPTNVGHTANEKVVGPLVPAKYSDPYKKMGLNDLTAKVYGMMTNLDENFGRLVKKLDELKIRDNTILIFTTDDGPGREYNAGLRTGSVYEARIRVPFVIQWPEVLNNSPKVIDRIASHIDILPTLLEACNLKIKINPVIDGVSLFPLLTGDKEEWEDRNLFFQCHRGPVPKRYQNCIVVGQQYKIVGYPGTDNKWDIKPSMEHPALELYDLMSDPGEKNNIAAQNPEILKSLKKEYDKWYDDVKNERQFEPGLIHIGSEAENPVYLSRYQDGHYSEDQIPTGWPVVIEKAGHYKISIKRPESYKKGSLVLQIDNDRVISKSLEGNSNSCVFNLPKGKFKINIWCEEEGETYKPRSSEDLIGDVTVKRL
jgi:arylsulfatase A-like enzyme